MTLMLHDLQAAQARIKGLVHRTPVLTSDSLDAMSGARLFWKCENFQKVGAFKARGATNAVFMLSEDEARRGVATHSSGNHAAALARAAKLRGIPAYVIMPTSTPKVKEASVRRYGGVVTFCEPTLEARETTTARVMAETGATLVHPYNDLRVMAGQGTAALELLADVPDLDAVLCPVGGGGLLSGTAVAVKACSPRTQVVAVEPALADDAQQSFALGKLCPPSNAPTLADGLRTGLGELTFAEMQRHVDRVVTVSEAGIVRAMRLIWEVLKILVEPSAAVPFAAVLEGAVNVTGQRVGVLLSGGNVDLDRLPWLAPSLV